MSSLTEEVAAVTVDGQLCSDPHLRPVEATEILASPKDSFAQLRIGGDVAIIGGHVDPRRVSSRRLFQRDPRERVQH